MSFGNEIRAHLRGVASGRIKVKPPRLITHEAEPKERGGEDEIVTIESHQTYPHPIFKYFLEMTTWVQTKKRGKVVEFFHREYFPRWTREIFDEMLQSRLRRARTKPETEIELVAEYLGRAVRKYIDANLPAEDTWVNTRTYRGQYDLELIYNRLRCRGKQLRTFLVTMNAWVSYEGYPTRNFDVETHPSIARFHKGKYLHEYWRRINVVPWKVRRGFVDPGLNI